MAATNVQAFSGDVEISSNLSVSGSKFTYDNTNTTVFTGTSFGSANEIGVWNVANSTADNTFIDVWVKSTVGNLGNEMHYQVYNRPDGGTSTAINSFERNNGNIAPVVYRTNATDMRGGVIRIGYGGANSQFITWRVEVTTRSQTQGDFQVTNTGSAVDGTGLVQVTPAPATELNSNLAIGGSQLFVDTVGGNVGIGVTNPDFKLTVLETTTATDSVIYPLAVRALSSGTVANGFGVGIRFQAERTDTDDFQYFAGGIKVYGANGLPGANDQWNMGFNVRNNDTSVTPMTLAHTDRVGIGVTNPACKLEIKGEDVMIRGSTPSINFSEILTSGVMDGGFRIRCDGANQADGNNFLAIQTGTNFGVTALHCTRDGNVGIGTTNPRSKLDIYTGSTASRGIILDRYATGNYRTEFYQGSSGLDIKVGNASVAPASVAHVERFSATNSRLRIASPGNIRTDGGVEDGSYNDISNTKLIFDTGGRFRIFTNGEQLYFSAAGGNGTLAATTVLTMQNTGRSVGIGTTNPGNYGLYVDRSARLGSGTVIDGASYLDQVYFDTFGEGSNKACLFRATEDDDNVYFRFRNQQSTLSREIGAAIQGYLQEYSDDRLKVNERYLTDGLDVIKRLKPQVYDKRPDLVENLERDGYSAESIERKEVGFIAQDIYYEVPELKHIIDVGGGVTPAEHITIGDDPTEDPDYSSWGNVAAGVRYTEIIPYNTAAIQDLSNLRDLDVDRITVLESQVSNLLARVQTLESGTP
jgi:hypothetical protein